MRSEDQLIRIMFACVVVQFICIVALAIVVAR